MRRYSALGLLLLLAAAIGACAQPEVAPTPSPVPSPPVSAPSPGGVTIVASEHPELGTVLADAGGRTLYLFTGDERKVSNCSTGCAEAFPPLLTVGDPVADEGVSAGRLDTLTREDGSTQATYNGWPLYYFAADEKAGDAMGQNVGEVWFVVSTDGAPIQSSAIVRTSNHPELGTVLTEASGRTVYLFIVDYRNQSNCSGGCAVAWPPLLTVGEPVADEGVSAGRLGTITRQDGSTQVAYNGWPLYYFAPDQKPGRYPQKVCKQSVGVPSL